MMHQLLALVLMVQVSLAPPSASTLNSILGSKHVILIILVHQLLTKSVSCIDF
jgi:hypothetical protein